MSPLTILAAAFVLGLGCGLFLPAPPASALIATGLGILVSAVAIRQKRRVGGALIGLVFVAAWARPRPAPPVSEGAPPCLRLVEGEIQESVRIRGENRIEVALTRWSECLPRTGVGKMRPARGRLYIRMNRDTAALPSTGEGVRLRARIRPVISRRNRGVPRWSAREPVYSAVVSGREAIVRVAAASPLSVAGGFDRWRAAVAAVLIDSLPPRSAAYARALILGESEALEHSARLRFRRTGTAHLISVSGLHLGLVTLLVFLVTSALALRTPLARRMDIGRVAAIIAIPAAIAFALLTGGRTPVVRACIMAVCALLARLIGRRAGTSEALAVAAVVILMADPVALLEPGFQLSFTAVLGFLVTLRGGGDIERGTSRKWFEAPLRALGRLLAATTAACAVTTPLVLYHFGYVSLAAIPANLLAVPLTGIVIMPLLLLVLLTTPIAPGIAALICIPAGVALDLLDALLEGLSALPCTLETPGPLGSAGVVIICIALLLMLTRRRRRGIATLTLGTALSMAGVLADPSSFPRDRLTIDFLDVGQGDSILVTSPSGDHLLVDAGGTRSGRYDVGERVVAPALRALGVTELSTVVLTHPDFDHAGGMAAVLESFPVGELWESGQGLQPHLGIAHERIHAAARRRQIPVRRTPSLCGVHRFGGATVAVLHPCRENGFDPLASTNGNSVVLLITFGDTRALLTGDIDREVERRLAERLPEADLLKLPHHGSASSTSEALLDALSPSLAVVSVGPFNPHGMPHGAVRRRLVRRGIRLLRTDRLGAIRVIMDGRGLSVSNARQVP